MSGGGLRQSLLYGDFDYGGRRMYNFIQGEGGGEVNIFTTHIYRNDCLNRTAISRSRLRVSSLR